MNTCILYPIILSSTVSSPQERNQYKCEQKKTTSDIELKRNDADADCYLKIKYKSADIFIIENNY